MKSLAKSYFLGLLFFLLGSVSLFAFPKSAYATTLTCSISSNLVGSSINVGDSFTVTLTRSGWVHSATGYKHGMYIFENGAYEVQNPYSSPTDGTPHGDWSATYSDGSSTTWSNTFTATSAGTITIAGVTKEDYEGAADNPPGVSCGAQLPGWITINQPPLANPTINCPPNTTPPTALQTYMYTGPGNPQEPPGSVCGYPAVFDVQGVDHNNPALYTGIQDNYGIFGTPSFSPATQGWSPLSKSGTDTVIPSWLVPPLYTGPTLNGTYTWGVQVKGTRRSDNATVYSNKTYATFTVHNPPSCPAATVGVTSQCQASGQPQFSITWPQAKNDTNGYKIERYRVSGATYDEYACVAGLSCVLSIQNWLPQPFIDIGIGYPLISGRSYYYKVSAENVYGACGYSQSPTIVANYCNGATFVSQTCPPAQMVVNRSFPAGVAMKNTGTKPWTTTIADPITGNTTTPHRLGSQNPQDNTTWGSGRVSLPSEPINPGSIAIFGFDTMKTPATTGTYNFQWRMLEEGIEWFGDTSPNCPVSVYNPVTVGSCSANPTATNTNTAVTFSANNVSGGTGSYNYSWTGDDGLAGTTQSVTKVGGYTSAGTKNATVTVTSGTLAPGTASCSAVVDDSPPPPPTSSVGVQVGAESACYTSSSWLTKNPFTITASDPQSGISKVTYKLQRNSTGLCYTGINGSNSFTVNCANSSANIVIYTAPGPYPLTPASVSKQVDIQFTTIDVPPLDNEYTLTATAYNGDLPTPLSAISSPPYRFKTAQSCGVPYLKTTGGDIHSNTNINIPNPSTAP